MVFVQYNIANCTIMVNGVCMAHEMTSLDFQNNNETVLFKIKQAMRLTQNTFNNLLWNLIIKQNFLLTH